MNRESIFIIFIFCGVAGISCGLVIQAIIAEKNLQDTKAINEENTYINYTNFTVLVTMGGNVCEGCHLSGKKFIPQAYKISQHTKGGTYCLKCHKISHEEHPVNKNVTCEKCHGKNRPEIPAPSEGKIVCNNCHAFPDGLMPSYGDLIVIHRPRGINCVTCHISCNKCHEKKPETKKWDKRIKHFNTLMISNI